MPPAVAFCSFGMPNLNLLTVITLHYLLQLMHLKTCRGPGPHETAAPVTAPLTPTLLLHRQLKQISKKLGLAAGPQCEVIVFDL